MHCKITVKNKADYFADFTYCGLFLERIPRDKRGFTVLLFTIILFCCFVTNDKISFRYDAKIPNTQLKKFSTTNIIKSFCYLISPEEVLLQLQQLDTSKASGPENIPNKFYELLAPMILPFLSEIFNGCYEKRDFPFISKHA